MLKVQLGAPPLGGHTSCRLVRLKKGPRATPLVTQQEEHQHQVLSTPRHHLLFIQKEDLSKN